MSDQTLYLLHFKGDIKLNRYAEMLIENGMLVPVEFDYEAARKHAKWIGIGYISRGEMAEIVNAALDGKWGDDDE